MIYRRSAYCIKTEGVEDRRMQIEMWDQLLNEVAMGSNINGMNTGQLL